MADARDDCELILKQLGLHDIIDRNRFPERTDKDVDLAVPQIMKQTVISAVQDTDLHVGIHIGERVDGIRQNLAADQGQGTDQDASGIVAQPRIDLGQTLIEFRVCQSSLARQNTGRRCEFESLCGFVEQCRSG